MIFNCPSTTVVQWKIPVRTVCFASATMGINTEELREQLDHLHKEAETTSAKGGILLLLFFSHSIMSHLELLEFFCGTFLSSFIFLFNVFGLGLGYCWRKFMGYNPFFGFDIIWFHQLGFYELALSYAYYEFFILKSSGETVWGYWSISMWLRLSNTYKLVLLSFVLPFFLAVLGLELGSRRAVCMCVCVWGSEVTVIS